MRRALAALVAGLLFGLGLTVSGMIDPAKVLGFLDLAGDWDPSLALVMATAVPVAAADFRLTGRWTRPLLAASFAAPSAAKIDVRLATGALLFGIGWGLVGYCPGPALASIGLVVPGNLLFVGSMLAGMAAFTFLQYVIGPRPKAA